MARWFQDPKTGLPEHRRAKLVSIFTFMDKVRGRVWGGAYLRPGMHIKLLLMNPPHIRDAHLLPTRKADPDHPPQDRTGKISFQGLQDFAKRHGGGTLGEAELRSIFRDFQPDGDSLITEPEFLMFFAKVRGDWLLAEEGAACNGTVHGGRTTGRAIPARTLIKFPLCSSYEGVTHHPQRNL